jgi:hypothetical protein
MEITQKKKLKIELPYDPHIQVYCDTTHNNHDMCHPRCLPTNECVENTVFQAQTIGYMILFI